jgi:hypothetical protein
MGKLITQDFLEPMKNSVDGLKTFSFTIGKGRKMVQASKLNELMLK